MKPTTKEKLKATIDNLLSGEIDASDVEFAIWEITNMYKRLLEGEKLVGFDEGRIEGYDDGYEEGYDDGLTECD